MNLPDKWEWIPKTGGEIGRLKCRELGIIIGAVETPNSALPHIFIKDIDKLATIEKRIVEMTENNKKKASMRRRENFKP